MNRIEQLFAHMDGWRHLPAYQLERRADIFFSLYLAEVLEAETGVAVDPRFLPELPLRKGLIWPNKPDNKSVKVDYAVFAEDRSRLFLVELKTDVGSRRERQDDYLQRAREVGFQAILGGVIDIALATSAPYHEKYAHLLHALSEHGCLALPDDLMDFAFRGNKRGLRERLRGVQVTVEPSEFKIEVIYIQPTKAPGDTGVIDFESFAGIIEGRQDEVAQVFAHHLRRWVKKAGSERPSP